MGNNGAKQPQDHLRSLKKPMFQYVEFVGDPAAMDRLEQARNELRGGQIGTQARASLVSPEELDRLRAAVDEAENAVFDCTIKFKLQAISRKRYEALILEHPPTAEQKLQAQGKSDDEQPAFNADTFPMALISQSVVEITAGGQVLDLTPDEISGWLNEDEWNNNEIFTLWMTALSVNNSRRIGDLPKDFARTRSSV